MFGLILDNLQVPRPFFAHEAALNNWYWHTSPYPEKGLTQIEIALTHQGNMAVFCEGTEYRNEGLPFLLCTASSVNVRVEDIPPEDSAPETIRECTISILWNSAHVRFGELTEEIRSDPNVLLLPLFLCPCPELSRVERLILAYISSSVSGRASDIAFCISAWYELISLLDRFARQPERRSQSRAAEYYTKKIDYWIETRYNRKLSLAEMAEEMHVTPNYLSSVYRKVRGMRFGEALLAVRMKKARELLRNRALSPADVAEAVGFGSEVTFRRKFRRFYGVTPSEFRRIDGELPLLVEKPIRPPEIESGIENS